LLDLGKNRNEKKNKKENKKLQKIQILFKNVNISGSHAKRASRAI